MFRRMIALSLLALAVPSSAANRIMNEPSNSEMTAIFNADQKARQVSDIDWATVGPQDKLAPLARTFKAKLRPVQCSPITGADMLVNRTDLRWIVVGEIHGTKETPVIFGDLACLASTSRPVIIAVEQVTTEQPAIDDFIGSDGGAAAISHFLRSRIWTQPMKDGRSSEAYFHLFQRLRELRAAGRIISVVAFQPLYNPGPGGYNAGDYEYALASSLVNRVKQDARVLVLVGNVHAMRTAPTWAKPAYLPMAGYLPAQTTINLDARWVGGSYWACTSDTSCGAQTAPSSGTRPARSITMDVIGGPYAGALNLGVEVTASPPQTQSPREQDPPQ